MKYYNLKDKILLDDPDRFALRYIGESWFYFLKEESINFVIRLRKKNYKEAVNASEGKSYVTLEKQSLRRRKVGKALGETIFLQGKNFTLVVLKNPKEEADKPLLNCPNLYVIC